ncbi:MAG: tRNA methyltransferase [Chlamydiae bacterium SM23_39]|nr:MAG: tRNA methyltransferase [Chlamydiae bacterium SM23_39]
MKIILFQPEIPQNTGNILRTCFLTNTELILVKPLGFSISSRKLKRSSIDYFNEIAFKQIDDLFSFLLETKNPFYFFSSKVDKIYTEIKYSRDAILIFGSETKGLPKNFKNRWEDRFFSIPMKKNSRCLNLANAVSIVLYEALRQQNFIMD